MLLSVVYHDHDDDDGTFKVAASDFLNPTSETTPQIQYKLTQKHTTRKARLVYHLLPIIIQKNNNGVQSRKSNNGLY